MCVIICLLLQDKICLPTEQLEHWLDSYLDLLYRNKLWNEATQLLQHCSVESIMSRNQESTLYLLACSRCQKPIQNNTAGICEHCQSRYNLCSLCHSPVSELYVWCQVCSHGGHLSCLKDWFSVESECCSGCGHFCKDFI